MKNVKNESFIIIKKQYVEENSNVIKFVFFKLSVFTEHIR